MEIAWIEAFIAVVDHGGFSRAADALHKSQPSVSSHLAALERELGAVLLDRRKRPVMLTDTGEAFLKHARSALGELDAGRYDVAAVSGLHRGRVRFGSYPSASAGFLPAVLERFSSQFPGIDFALLESGTLELEDDLVNDLVDVIIRPVGSPFEADGLRTRVLWREPLDAVLPPGHPLSERDGPLDAALLTGVPIITSGRRRSSYIHTDRFWQETGLRRQVVFEPTQPQTMIALVRAGHGVGVTNRLAIRICDTSGLVVRPLAGPDPVREVAIHWMELRPLPAAARAFVDVLLSTPAPDGIQSLVN